MPFVERQSPARNALGSLQQGARVTARTLVAN
jgi:hypothetical protein